MPDSSPTPTVADNASNLLLRQINRPKLSAQDQLEALRKAQAQAEQRVRLGLKLFDAAENRLKADNQAVRDLREQQQSLRERMRHELQQSIEHADVRFTGIEDRITAAVENLSDRMTALEQNWQTAETRLNRLVSQAEQLLDQAEKIVDTPPAFQANTKPPTPQPQPDQPAARDQDQAWNEVYHRALLWLGQSSNRNDENQPPQKHSA